MLIWKIKPIWVKLIYELNKAIIELSAENAGFTVKMNGKKVNSSLLPSNIVVYYSGLSDKMEKLCKIHEENQEIAFRKGQIVKRPLFYYRPKNFKMFLLSLFAFEFGDTKDFILNKINVDRLKSFSIEILEPEWNKRAKKRESASNFWGIRGVNESFLNKLDEFSNNKVVNKNDSIIEYTFNSIEKLYEIKTFIGDNKNTGEKTIFESLDMLFYQGILGDISLSLEKNTQIIDSDALSEGEKQIIAIRGINDLLVEENTLLLFDEPDTYLHPSWQSQFTDEIIHYSEKTQFVVTTHSPQLLTNMNPKFAHLSYIENGKLNEFIPYYYGRDINSILYGLMNTEERNKDIDTQLTQLSRHIALNQIEKAENLYIVLAEKIGKDEPKLIAAAAEIDFIKSEEE